MAERARKHFTLDEAQRLIPVLEGLVTRVVAAHGRVNELRAALEEAQRDVMLAGGVRLDQEFWRSRRTGLAEASTALRTTIGEILELGAVPKDLGMGLIDFPSFLQDREINLCWRLGETQIRFWHGLDEGYAQRKPLPGTTGRP